MTDRKGGLVAARLTGKVALVTGASRGIGAAIAMRLRAEGAVVVGLSRTRPSPATGPAGQVEHVQADVAQPEAVRAAVDEVVRRHGRLDVLVNNAGVEREGTVEETTLEAWSQVMDTNVRGVFLLSKYSMPHLRASRGAIVNIASVDGSWAEPGLAAYSTAKGAVLALTRAIAIDHGPDGVRCNSISPGYVATDMLEQFFEAQTDPSCARSQAAGTHALRRFSTPEEVAAVAAFLASSDASFITGQSIVVDGGLTCGRAFALDSLLA